MIQNNLLLQALKGETVARPPVWMMRQAGRYLPEFRALKEKYDFFTRCQTPELVTEITIQPIDIIGPDAAILFSDILVIPQAMGVGVGMKPNIGPWIEHPIRTQKDVDNVRIADIDETLDYVMQGIQMTKKALNNRVPLIGFAGAPWTILCYMVQGQGSKTFDITKKFCFKQPQLAHQLLDKITQTTIKYLQKKVANGCDAIQLFDSWGGLLSPNDYETFSWQYNKQIVNELSRLAPVIFFGKGCWYAYDKMIDSNVAALGVDWTCSARNARYLTQNKVTLQGNFDPTRLYSPIDEIKKMVRQMIDEFGKNQYIVNLGHGILPDIPVDHARAFVDAVKEYTV